MSETKVIFAKTTDKIIISGKLSDDKMKLFIDAEPVDNQIVTKEEFKALIAEFAKNAEINDGVIDDIYKHLQKNEKVVDRRIAKGTPAVDGADGKILLLYKKFTPQPEVKEDRKGYAELTELHLFDNVTKGQIVGRVYPPKSGTDGLDALGAKIPAKVGKPIKPSTDSTVTLKEQTTSEQPYQTIVAEEDGFLMEDAGKISIKPELTISGDLDFHYGNIDFIGKVIVGGDVLQGLNIKAAKGIEVKGSIRGGSLICMGGDIVVKGYVYGGKDSRIICGKSFSCTVAQEIHAEIAGDILIHKEAVDCMLRSETTIYVKDGQLVGGECYAVCGVEAKFLGNQANKETIINFCSDVESHTDYSRLIAKIDSHDKAKKLLEMHLGPLATNPSRIQLLRSPHREKMQSLYTKLQEVERSRISLKAEQKTMLEKARSNQVIRANYLAVCNEGVLIRAGDKIHAIKEEIKGPGSITYTAETSEFSVGDYLALECTYNRDDSIKIEDKEKNGQKEK
jgi:uncharacterized protein (DUF342 family)